jgi:hypothetical protein
MSVLVGPYISYSSIGYQYFVSLESFRGIQNYIIYKHSSTNYIF